MNKAYRKKQIIRFRYWIRKAYAMFCSLGKCVTIGNLRKGIADISLGKQANLSVGIPCHEKDRSLIEEDLECQAGEETSPFGKMIQQIWIPQALQDVAVGVGFFLLLICFYFSKVRKMRHASF